ncbi:MAG TPA: sulfur carrier protein ThiS [Firmicutes bacterium]|jgi:sulfur carrier protein|nr:sulfur carrier protein ThiS [Bacillota bacterium]HOQ24514.1 sulfur carrier protein ThiS [Bacillota bacterium]HPT67346.1 sulfur carrier protein ThiS [Bacillota bacterium]
MEVLINGQPTAVAPGTKLLHFITAKGLEPKAIVVEYNGAVLAPEAFGATTFQPGDRIEILRFVGGG